MGVGGINFNSLSFLLCQYQIRWGICLQKEEKTVNRFLTATYFGQDNILISDSKHKD